MNMSSCCRIESRWNSISKAVSEMNLNAFAMICVARVCMSAKNLIVFFFFVWNHVLLWERIISMRNKWIEEER